MTSWHDSFYDSIANKYATDKDNDPAMPKPRKYKRLASSVLRDLKLVIEDIRDNSGFNTNAPDSMFARARELFEELKDRLRDKSAPTADLRFLDKANFALLDKLDYMEALEFLNKMEVK
jgi:hypothetical protein